MSSEELYLELLRENERLRNQISDGGQDLGNDEKFQLDEFCLQYRDANAWLLDAVIDGYGGGGQTFNWDMIDSLWVKENAHRVVLSGGLNVKNVGDAIAYFHPLAVDISSGVEVQKGLKDPYLMKAFVAQVRLFDQPDKH